MAGDLQWPRTSYSIQPACACSRKGKPNSACSLFSFRFKVTRTDRKKVVINAPTRATWNWCSNDVFVHLFHFVPPLSSVLCLVPPWYSSRPGRGRVKGWAGGRARGNGWLQSWEGCWDPPRHTQGLYKGWMRGREVEGRLCCYRDGRWT